MFNFGDWSPMQMAGLQLLTSSNPNETLSNLPMMMWKMKQDKVAQDMELKKMEILEKQFQIQQAAEGRDAAAFSDKQKYGQTLGSRYDLSPNLNTPDVAPPPIMADIGRVYDPNLPEDQQWSADKMVTRQWKGDAAVPFGEEGNPQSLAIMDLPLSIRQAWKNAPLAAADQVAPAVTAGLTDIFSPSKSSAVDADIKNIRLPDGTIRAYDWADPRQRFEGLITLNNGGILANEYDQQPPVSDSKPSYINLQETPNSKPITLDVSTPEGRAKAEELINKGYSEVSTQTPIKTDSVVLDENAAGQFKNYSDWVASEDQKVDQLSNLAAVYSQIDVYRGTGASAINSTLKAARDILGVDIKADLSTPAAAAQFRRSVIAAVRSGVKDTNVSNFEQKGIEAEIISLDDSPESVAKAVAIRQLSVQYAKDKVKYIQNLVDTKGMTIRQAMASWDEINKDNAILQKYLTPENIESHAKVFMDPGHVRSAVEYLQNLNIPGAASVRDEINDLSAPESTPVDIPISGDGKVDTSKLTAGTVYITPRGAVRFLGFDASGNPRFEDAE